MQSQNHRSFFGNIELVAAYSPLIAIAISTVSLVVWVLDLCRYGIEFTDEGYYLNWISKPWAFSASHTQFGFVYHPLYLLVSGDIPLLRQANVLISLGLAWLVFLALFKTNCAGPQGERPHPILPFAAISLTFGSSALPILYMWLPTPNYNSLALQALLIATLGLILSYREEKRSKLTGHLVIGLSGWLAFMAKPTTAFVLGALIGMVFLASRNLKVRQLAVSAAVSFILILISAWCIDGSIHGFILRVATGAEDLKKLQGHHTLSEIFRMDSFLLFKTEKVLLTADTVLIAVATYLSLSRGWIGQLISALLVVGIAIGCFSITAGFFHPNFLYTPFLGLQFCAIPAGILLGWGFLPGDKIRGLMSLQKSAIFVTVGVVMPYALVFGTNNNYYSAMTAGVVFWVFAGVAMVTTRLSGIIRPWQVFLPAASVVHAGTLAILFINSEAPYRQSCPLRQNKDIAYINGTTSQLRISHESATYINDLNRIAVKGGFKAGSPMIDLTGRFPMAIYTLGAKPTGLAWLLGGYKGSEDMITSVFDRASLVELKRAWILMEPNGPRKHTADILARYGLNITTDYVEVGTLISPKGEYSEKFEQYLLKPKATATLTGKP